MSTSAGVSPRRGRVDGDDARAGRADETLDGRGDRDVACDAIAPRDDEHAGTVGAERGERSAELWTLGRLGRARHAGVDVDGGDPHAGRRRPPLDRLALGFDAKPLLVGAHPTVGDRDGRVAGGRAAGTRLALAHVG